MTNVQRILLFLTLKPVKLGLVPRTGLAGVMRGARRRGRLRRAPRRAVLATAPFRLCFQIRPASPRRAARCGRGAPRLLSAAAELTREASFRNSHQPRAMRQRHWLQCWLPLAPLAFAAQATPWWKKAVVRHVREVGAQPSTRETQAYATMFYGETRGRSFDGVKALVHSIRAVDEYRPIVLMLPVDRGVVDQPEADANLVCLQRAVPNVLLQRVPRATIFRNTSKVCVQKSSCGRMGGRSYTWTYSKFALWNLTSWSRILYLDIDMLVLQSLESIFETPLGTTDSLVAASLTIRSKLAKGLDERPCGSYRLGSGSKAYNTGLLLLQPSHIMAARLARELGHAVWSSKSPCKSDQTLFNKWFVPNHVRCLPYSVNCREPRVLNATDVPSPNGVVSRLSRCLEAMPRNDAERRQRELEARKGEPVMGNSLSSPYTVHFACISKPWLPQNEHDVFARKWRWHLATVDDKMAAVKDEGRKRRR